LRVANINALPFGGSDVLHPSAPSLDVLHIPAPSLAVLYGVYMVLIVTFATSAHIAILHTSAKGLQERKETTSPPKTKLTKYTLILITLHPYYIPLGFRF